MRRAAAVLTMTLALCAAPGPPAQAIEVCRENALGQIACTGKPTHGLDPIVPFAKPSKSGLSRVQKQPGDTGATPKFVPSIRTDSFGDTVLGPGDSTRPRPRICVPDSFGNLRC